ncbi:MAG: HD domain-containing protein [Desulfuromonadales bacterium]|nr:HD domain-containing protein [Desulfuromonadales bacterium]
MKKVFVKDIQERDLIATPFLVRDKIIAMAKNGRPYMTLKLMDCTGEVEGRIWDRVDELSLRFNKDDFVQVTGKASVYMGKMQLILQDLERIEESAVELSDFLPVSMRPVAEMVSELKTVVEGLIDPNLRNLMKAFLADEAFMAGYTRAPAAKAMHHVYLGGLLEHSLAVAVLANDISQRYPDLNRDLLVVGALLHDVGKVAELRYQRSFEYTDAGKLLGHIMIGVELVEEKLRTLQSFPQELAIHLKHLLLSHHGQYEYGSPKRPKTMEAVILNFLDDLDSKINGVRTHINREPDRESSWTQYHRLYDRYFFKGGTEKPAAEPELDKTAAKPARSARPLEKGRSGHPQPRFSNTLGEQLQGKKLDLFGIERQDNKDE